MRQRGEQNPNWKGGISQVQRAASGPGNKMYAKGKRRERKARLALEADGYYVIRSAASKGIFDLVGLRAAPPGVRLLQIKTNAAPPRAERQAIADFAAPAGATKEIWIYRDGWREPEIMVVA